MATLLIPIGPKGKNQMSTEQSTGLIVSFKHYEHQGIDLKLTPVVGGGHLLEVIRCDTQAILLKVELPSTTALFDRRN